MTRAIPGEMLTGSHTARPLVDAQSLCVTVPGGDALSGLLRRDGSERE
jgi:hypothetical protein